MIRTIIRIPVKSNDDFSVSYGYLRKEIEHSSPLTVGLTLEGKHLSLIDDSGDRCLKPIVEQVSFDIDNQVYSASTTRIEIQGKLLNRDKWEFISKDSTI